MALILTLKKTLILMPYQTTQKVIINYISGFVSLFLQRINNNKHDPTLSYLTFFLLTSFSYSQKITLKTLSQFTENDYDYFETEVTNRGFQVYKVFTDK